MLYNPFHHKRLRLVAALVGELIIAISLNWFITPLHLYTGGVMGVCQLLSTLLQPWLSFEPGTHDIAGILYFLVNIPILALGFRDLGRSMVFKTVICATSFSLFYSVLPVPVEPIIPDYLTACLLGGILNGVGCGIVLTCGCSNGGLDILGLCLSKRGSMFTVGRFSLVFNIFLYAACLFLFTPEVAIYSVIYNFFSSMMMDRMHQQNVNVQVLIFTREDEGKLARYIMEELERGVTCWNGTGAYTGVELKVLCVCLSRYEIGELARTIHAMDPHAFFTVQKGVSVYGNFHRKLG